eukprot:4829333-Pleurochrysis_carterae.AAC.1
MAQAETEEQHKCGCGKETGIRGAKNCVGFALAAPPSLWRSKCKKGGARPFPTVTIGPERWAVTTYVPTPRLDESSDSRGREFKRKTIRARSSLSGAYVRNRASRG